MEVEVLDVTKEFNKVSILNGISLKINDGDTSFIVGKNGAGKTTLIRIILNLYKSTSGKVLVDGVDVNSSEYVKVKESIGFLNDNIGLFKDFTAWDNIEFFHRIYFPNAKASQRRSDIEKVLKRVDLYSNRNNKITFFSRGMRQRLAIARSIINNPNLLILDEPSRGLDIEGKEMLKDIIEEYQKKNATILINSHDLDDFQDIATKIAFIKKGKIVYEGSYKDVKGEFGDNMYAIKVQNSSNIESKLERESFVDNIKKIDDELIVSINTDVKELSDWLYNNSIKINELKQINDNLSYLYKKILS